MPINIPNSLPATKTLEAENIFVMNETAAKHQDIRPLKIAILNLMPTKIDTETQLLRLLGNTPLQVDIELLQTASHKSKNTPSDHLFKFYKSFDEIKHLKFDGLVITGAPVENMEFESVNYWKELCTIMEWSKHNVYSTFHICWAAQAGLYYHYNINKIQLEEKVFGIYPHKTLEPNHQLLRGFDETFFAPHSRYTTISREDIESCPNLQLLSFSDESGVYIVCSKDGRQFFVTGHSEYDRETLGKEYFRDIEKGLDIKVPYNYFTNDDPSLTPPLTWRGHSNLLFSNWLNYFVYQQTPFDLSTIE